MRATPEAITEHARDLRACSIYPDLKAWIEHAADNATGASPEAEIATTILTALCELQGKLEPQIERLAVRCANREAAENGLDGIERLRGLDLARAIVGAPTVAIEAMLREPARPL